MTEPVFTFPFKPYAIQEEFMRSLYSTLENGNLGIFESPTGTGKSLSICCGALQWLKDSHQKTVTNLQNEITQLKAELASKSDADDWLTEEYEKIKKKQTLVSLQNKLDNITKKQEYYLEMKNRVIKQKLELTKKGIDCHFKVSDKSHNEKIRKVGDDEIDEDADIILEEVQEDEESEEESEPTPEEDTCHFTKIYISSRTHSQLSQFVGEIKRTVFKENTRVVTLASRQHYCINPEVNRLKNVNLINERCLDLQKSKSKSTSVGDDGKVLKKCKTKSCGSCPYYNQSRLTALKERLLVDLMDMEDIVKSGKELKACPYYASRMALEDAEVVLVSHAGVVQPGSSLPLSQHVLIVDEAHALSPALAAAHAAPVTSPQLTDVRDCLQRYIKRYEARLGSRNLLKLNQLLYVTGKLIGMINNLSGEKVDKIFTIEDFVIKADIDHINLRPLVEFCEKSRLAQKLRGFATRYAGQETDKPAATSNTLQTFLNNMAKKKVEEVPEESKETDVKQTDQPVSESVSSAVYSVRALLGALCGRAGGGRVRAGGGGGGGRAGGGALRYLLLEPRDKFAGTVASCRAVVLAGGTMRPADEFRRLLGAGKGSAGGTENAGDAGETGSPRRVVELSVSHVVRADRVLAAGVGRGPAGGRLLFTYENRGDPALSSEVSRLLVNVSRVAPGGVVVFVSSYAAEETLHRQLETSGALDCIRKKKKMFREPKSAAEVDQVLSAYAAACTGGADGAGGAMLLSVVGGKLSEGLNFSDSLGRCVVVLGLPYPPARCPELAEKMSFLDRTAGPGTGSQYYENLCMKAVNQCIGRAIRHVNDYACILLVDERYSRPQTISALPSFIQNSLTPNCTFGQTMGMMAKFFARHRQAEKETT